MNNTKWDIVEGKTLRRRLTFQTFPEAVAFVERIVPIAEAHHHHPDITISYNKVTLELTTHEEGRLTHKDYALAEEIDALI